MVTINRSLLPIKAHYFFFMAAMGPILPQTNVFGKQLGIAPDVMGLITSVLPIMYILAKPTVGYLIDYFASARKVIFMSILLVMTLCYAGFYFVPLGRVHRVPLQELYEFEMGRVASCRSLDPSVDAHVSLCSDYRPVQCAIECRHAGSPAHTFSGYLSTYRRQFVANEPAPALTANDSDVFLLGSLDGTSTAPAFAAAATVTEPTPVENATAHYFSSNINFDLCLADTGLALIGNKSCSVECRPDATRQPDCVLGTSTFWWFVCLMCVGTIGFNVANCVSDATCFDMLGESQTMNYGAQRVWGTIGFGVSALLAGVAVHAYGPADATASIAPALIIMLVFSSLDVLSIQWLRLPVLSSATSIWTEVTTLLRQRTIVVFLVFATLAGILDSFIIYYMFWHLEEVAARSGHLATIKLIEGCVVAAECLGGEILFFLVSGRILKRIGYVHCLSVCFAMYAVRMALISLIENPWWLVAVEFFMQGPTYALCYTCIVAYASAVSPPGTTATVQGLVAGMDDGVGFAIGSLIGGQTFHRLGGARSFQAFSVGALVICVLHILLRPADKHETMVKSSGNGTAEPQRPEVRYDAVPLEQVKAAAEPEQS